jgi:hypothetical protein
MQRFLSVIFNNTAFYSEDDFKEDAKIEGLNVVVGRLQRCIERLREANFRDCTIPEYHNRFVEDSVRKLFPEYGSFDELAEAAAAGEAVLRFTEEDVREFIRSRDYPADYLIYGGERKVAAALRSHGRAVILLEPYEGEKRNGIDPDTQFFTGVIESKAGRAWIKEDHSKQDEGKTRYGLVKCPEAAFRGGMHFAITDAFPFDKERYLYAVNVSYIEGGNPMEAKPLDPDEVNEMRKSVEKGINEQEDGLSLLYS